jgi:hypothetical protein
MKELVSTHNHKLFVGVDEYDAPANLCLFSGDLGRHAAYPAVAELFKTHFFAVMKQACGRVVEKYWLTGVLPVFRDGISPLSATDVISSKPQFHGLCGLTDGEVDTILKAYLSSTYNDSQLKEAMARMKEWYNGYRFCPDHIPTSSKLPSLYNPQLVFSHLRALAQGTQSEALLEEANSTHCATVLNAIRCDGPINFNDIFLDVLSGQLVADVMPYFGVDNVKEIGADPVITWTILYYFGVFTHGPGRTLQLPNATMKYLVRVTLS